MNLYSVLQLVPPVIRQGYFSVGVIIHYTLVGVIIHYTQLQFPKTSLVLRERRLDMFFIKNMLHPTT